MAHEDAIRQAAALVAAADGLLIAAGAGMGVDSGLPDFRGTEGFWRAYPPLGRLGLAFHEIACPDGFETDARLAWGFYGHRLALYRATRPHAGFGILRAIGTRMAHGSFVFTSNVDGQFQRAGFAPDAIVEYHGSIHHLQCTRPCVDAIWPADSVAPSVDMAQCRLVSALPRCPRCGAMARPNILMFNDGAWLPDRSEAQMERFARWRADLKRPAVIELGAGVDIPSVRRMAEAQGMPVIRINPRAAAVRNGIALELGALAALRLLAEALNIDPSQSTS
ncbi:Sir2 family NAD-dependent protein deacetylase [Massilia sp. IC2-476]|uniref:SIR2 family NAD-dependent protein deacylase n=1 Tax=Massilia sp. IC2-476 TaxID=2887199 RepID=UPI001D1184EC|nr:Sir2 family NAD-dependent protein deacetylase [Massilia sp. IC2-476]MCC2973743.1 NAD-dependent deacetylase [Massilia sp. IC2-476]